MHYRSSLHFVGWQMCKNIGLSQTLLLLRLKRITLRLTLLISTVWFPQTLIKVNRCIFPHRKINWYIPASYTFHIRNHFTSATLCRCLWDICGKFKLQQPYHQNPPLTSWDTILKYVTLITEWSPMHIISSVFIRKKMLYMNNIKILTFPYIPSFRFKLIFAF